MNSFTPKTNEEINFVKCSLLMTSALSRGLQTLLLISKEERDSEVLQSYDFEKLCHLLTTQEHPHINSKVQNGLSKLAGIREQFFRALSSQCFSDNDLEDLTRQLIEIFKELEIPLNDIHETCSITFVNEGEILLAHEKLNREKRNFCCLGPKCFHETIQRPKEVEVILKQFLELNRRNPKGNSTIFIDGGRGAGKSELARQVAEECWKSDGFSKPEIVMVVNAETEETLLLSYVKFAKELLCNFTHVENAITSPGLMVEERLRLLKHIIGTKLKKHSHWLLVIDNVNHYETFSSYWPSPGSDDWGRGHIIVTLPDISNVDKSSFFFTSGHMKLADGMDPSEAVQLLCEVSKINKDDNSVKAAEVLQFQPLALACAAVFVRHWGKFDFPWECYIESFNKSKKEMAGEKGGKFNSYSESCSIAIHMLQTQLQAQNQGVSSIDHLLNIIQPLSIEREKLDCFFKDSTCTNMEQHINEVSPFLSIERQGIGEKESFSLRHGMIDRNLPGLETNQVSTLIAATALLAHELSDLKNAQSVLSDNVYSVSSAASHLASEITKLTDQETREYIDQLNEHTTTKTEACAFDILLLLTQQCRLIQKLEQSAVFLTVAKDVLEREGTSSLRFGEVLYNLGITIRDLGDVKAKKHLEEALEIFTEQRDENKVTELMTALGDVALNSEDITEAKAFYEKALKDSSKQSNKTTATLCCFKLGNVFAMERSFYLAKEYYEKALSYMDDTNFMDLIKVLTCAGAMSICVEDYQLARDYLEKAMDIEKRLYSKFHPCRQSAIKNAANACKALEDNDSVEKLLKESLEISQNVPSRLDAEVAQVFSQIGSLKSAQEDLKSAIECYTKALEIQSSTLNCHIDPGIANTYCDLGDVYARNGEFEMARSLHERALGIRGLVFKPDHPDLGTSYFCLGKVYSNLDDHQTAQSLLERAVEIRGKIFGLGHPDTLNSIYYLGNSHARFGNFHNAKKLYETVVQEQEKLQECNKALAKTTESLAETNLSLGNVTKAKKQFKRAIELQAKEPGEDLADVAHPLVRLALVHEHCNEITEAKTLLEKALDIYRKSFCKASRSRAFITEAHLKRIMSKLPHKGCVVM